MVYQEKKMFSIMTLTQCVTFSSSSWTSLDLRGSSPENLSSRRSLELLLDPWFSPSLEMLCVCYCPKCLLIIAKNFILLIDYFGRDHVRGFPYRWHEPQNCFEKISIVQKDTGCMGCMFFLWRKYCFTIFLLKFNSLNSTSLLRRKWRKETGRQN